MTDELKAPAYRRRRWGCALVGVVALLLLGWLAWTGWQSVQRVQRVQANLSALQALADPSTLMELQPQDLLGLRDQVAAPGR